MKSELEINAEALLAKVFITEPYSCEWKQGCNYLWEYVGMGE
jgi:hypothetical protein